jgi:hypothetical protein
LRWLCWSFLFIFLLFIFINLSFVVIIANFFFNLSIKLIEWFTSFTCFIYFAYFAYAFFLSISFSFVNLRGWLVFNWREFLIYRCLLFYWLLNYGNKAWFWRFYLFVFLLVLLKNFIGVHVNDLFHTLLETVGFVRIVSDYMFVFCSK